MCSMTILLRNAVSYDNSHTKLHIFLVLFLNEQNQTDDNNSLLWQILLIHYHDDGTQVRAHHGYHIFHNRERPFAYQ